MTDDLMVGSMWISVNRGHQQTMVEITKVGARSVEFRVRMRRYLGHRERRLMRRKDEFLAIYRPAM
jgi:hypothetical protein